MRCSLEAENFLAVFVISHWLDVHLLSSAKEDEDRLKRLPNELCTMSFKIPTMRMSRTSRCAQGTSSI